jgi:hypothetical protein
LLVAHVPFLSQTRIFFIDVSLLVVNFFFSEECIVVAPDVLGKPIKDSGPEHFFVKVELD